MTETSGAMNCWAGDDAVAGEDAAVRKNLARRRHKTARAARIPPRDRGRFQVGSDKRASQQAAEDYDLWLRVAEVTELGNLPEYLTLYRWHPGNVSQRKDLRQSFSSGPTA